MNEKFLEVGDVMQILGISRSAAYKLMRQINSELEKNKYGEIDCVIGGPPCPPYSQTRHYLVGKADGLNDEKAGFAVPEYFRAVEEIKPRVFFFENVDGFTFKTHTEAFDFLKERSYELGYNITYNYRYSQEVF